MVGLQDGGHLFRNKLLSRLPREGAQILARQLEPVSLKFRQRLEMSGRRIADVYFVEAGLVSIIGYSSHRRHQAEVAVLGSEGFTGCAALLGIERSSHDAMVQVGGSGLRINIDDFHELMTANPVLRDVLVKFVHASGVQVLHTAIASSRGTIEERLSRWLLMAHDRLRTDTIPLTHELLAVTLSVRRAGVTMALGRLSSLGLISYSRGVIKILDRQALVQHARDFYGEPEAEYERVFPEASNTRARPASGA